MAIEKLAHSNQGQDWSQFFRNLNQESSKGREIPEYYSHIAEQVEENYNRLPEQVKDSLEQMPPQIQASFFEVCGWVAQKSVGNGQAGSQISHFIASAVEQSAR